MNILHGGPVLSFSIADTDPLKIGSYTVPLGASVNASQQKIISKTQVGSNDGTIKEFSGFGDWTVDISFEFHGMAKTQAILELTKINAVWLKRTELPVINLKLQKLGITHLVIEELSLPDPDANHEIKVSMKCISDKQINLADPDNKGIMAEQSGVLEKVNEVLKYL